MAFGAAGRLFHSLYARLVLIYLASLIVMSLATAWLAVSQFDQLGQEWLQRNRIDLATNLARQFRQPLAAGVHSPAARKTAEHIKRINPALSIYVLDDAGQVIGAWGHDRCALGRRIPTAPVHELMSKMPMLPVYAALPCSGGNNVFSVARIHYGKNNAPGYLFVALEGSTHMSMSRMWQTSSISRSLLISGVAAFLLAAIVGLLLFAALTRRLTRHMRAVQHFADGDHSQRLPEQKDELGQVARAFNNMAATIEAQVAALKENDHQRRDLVANLSHDFRTPLTAVRGYAEQLRHNATGLDARQLDALLSNVERLTRLAEQLSLLSETDITERPLQTETFPLAELGQDIVGKFRSQADAAGIELVANYSGPTPVVADLELVDRALTNLVENALHATNHGGFVKLTMETRANQVHVNVTDSGIGIPADEIGLVTQRFYRTRNSRGHATGSGLGLAIVAEICVRHGTHLELSSNRQGTTASFALPAG